MGESIVAIGDRAFYDADSLVCIVTHEALQTIGTEAFSGCDSFNSVILYDAVTAIGENAFADCAKLTIDCNADSYAYAYAQAHNIPCNIISPSTRPDTVERDGITYYIQNNQAIAIGCASGISAVTIPAEINGYPVTELRETFRENKSITSVTLPDSLTKIGAYAFYFATNLVSVNIPDTITEIQDMAFTGCNKLHEVSLPYGLMTIGDQAFWGCDGIESITLPESLTSIGSSAFAYCDNLAIVKIPAGVTKIPYGTFSECPNLIRVVLAETVTEIGSNAFKSCYQLSSIVIPRSVTKLSTDSFSANTLLAVYPDSYAHSFAAANELPYALYDGVNLPGTYVVDGVTYVIVGEKAIAVECDRSLTEVTIAASVEGYPVVELRETFKEHKNIRKVTLPEGLEVIGSHTFYFATNLVEVNIPSTVTKLGNMAFTGCGKVPAFDLPEGLVSLGEQAFWGCDSIVSITLPDSLVSIGSYALAYCDNLESLTIPAGIKSISYGLCQDCVSLCEVKLPEAITSIGTRAFSNCRKLAYLEIPAGVTSLQTNAFASVTVLGVQEDSYAHSFAVQHRLPYALAGSGMVPDTYEIGGVTYFVANGVAMAIGADKTLTEIEVVSEVNGYPVTVLKETFRGHSNLTKVTLPETLTEIGSYAFYRCGNLVSVNLPDSVTKIGERAFYECFRLQVDELPIGLKSIGNSAFNDCDGITSITIRSSVTSIGSDIFGYCSNLTEVVLEEGISQIVSNMFQNCISLKSIRIPESVTYISGNAFENCIALESVELPEGLKTIYSNAFKDCSSLKTVLIPESVTYLYTSSFPANTILVVYEDSYAHGFADRNDLLYYIYSEKGYIPVYKVDGVTYYIIENEAVAVSCDAAATEVTIPATVEGYPVVELRETFQEHKSIRKVTLPEGLRLIGEHAFYFATNLTEVNIPTTVAELGNNAFTGCNKVKEFVLPEGLTTIGDQAFFACDSITNIVLPESVVKLGSSVFSNCDGLVEITITGGITELPYGTFSDCVNLIKVNIPEQITSIGLRAFHNCAKLRSMLVPETVTSMYEESFAATTILIVKPDSYAHTYAAQHNLLYFVIQKAENPEVSFGTGVCGTVIYSDGTAAANTTVEIRYEDGTLKETVKTDASGAYAFTYAEVGQYTICATDSTGNTASVQISVKRMNAFDVFVSGDTGLTLKKSYTVSGTVNEGAAQVTVTDLVGNVIASTTADQNGAFAIGNISNGTYIITAESATGIASQEITVFNGDLTGISLVIAAEGATIWGYVSVQDRDGAQSNRNWVQVTIYNRDGVAVAQGKSDANGKYTFPKLPIGTYSIVAQTSEMRPDKNKGFDRSHTLTGYAYVVVTAAEQYRADIVLYEETDHLTKISGKVTAHGQKQSGTVILRDVFQNEIASYNAKSNGKYSFSNVRDGLYFITAITESEGMGYAVVVVRDGEVYGETDITVEKHDKIKAREQKFNEEVPVLSGPSEAQQYRSRIAEEKNFYDSLSKKEKKQLSKDYVERLNLYVEWLAAVEYTAAEGVSVEQGGLVVSGDELEQDCQITYIIDVQKTDGYAASTDGIYTQEDHLHYSMEDAAKEHTIQQHYEITMYKSVDGQLQSITDVQKDTDTTGKFRITLEIPEEYRGYKHFSILHEHHGEIVQLTDLDEDPNTITVEVDAFSDFVLTATNLPLIWEMLFGDIDGNEAIDYEDAVYLLLHALFGDTYYPLEDSEADIDGNGIVDQDDAIYLLLHTLFGDAFYPMAQ